MGNVYEKDGHLYEEGVFGDRDLGEIHENFDGSRETRNILDTNYKLEPDRSFSAEMGPILAGPLAPLCKPADQIVTRSDGETGRMVYDEWRGRREYHPDESPGGSSSPDYSAESGGSGGSYSSGSPDVSYRSKNITASTKDKKEGKKWGFWDYALAIGVGLLVVGILDGAAKDKK